ncbi:hypothetical protein [Paenibacillus paridis]|uniref:hypothetical protein n=1 Tax=Paenibacillus paridis TaxID=2583376 RepID=UPI001121BA09|nr:hypothetical protein [Paenibacillus paridis]
MVILSKLIANTRRHLERNKQKTGYNGTGQVGEAGQTGESRNRYSPQNVPYTVYFHTDGNEIEILLLASNFDYKSAGIANSLYFGPATAVAIYKNVRTSLSSWPSKSFVAYSSMRQLTQQLQIANRMKDEFLLLTSHEHNTPCLPHVVLLRVATSG